VKHESATLLFFFSALFYFFGKCYDNIRLIFAYMQKRQRIVAFIAPLLAFFLAAAPASAAIALYNPLSNVSSPQELIGRIINTVLGLVGSIALLMFVYGGLVWLTSGGASDKIKKGREIFTWSAIGLLVIFTSYALVYFLVKNISK